MTTARGSTTLALVAGLVALLTLATERSAVFADGPTTTTTTAIGQSTQGRPIEVACIGEGDQTALLVGGIHTGMESNTASLALEMAVALWTGNLAIPCGIEVCVLPVLNPDGIALGLHTNARGVDLNRNWPTDDWEMDAWHPETGPVSDGTAPLSEPETRALYDYVRQTRPDLVVVWHCCGALVEANESPRAVALSSVYAEAAGFAYLDVWRAYVITGELIVGMDRLGIPAFDVELESTSRTGLQTHLRALAAMLDHMTASGPVSTTVVEGDTPMRLYSIRAGDSPLSVALKFGIAVGALLDANAITSKAEFIVGRILAVPRVDAD